MQQRAKHRRWIFSLVIVIMTLTVATPVLAEYIGPNRTVTETYTACRIVLNECQFVESKGEWKYKDVESWSCSLESKPWQAYSSNNRPCNDTLHTNGYQYWEREDVTKTETNTYLPATINSVLQSCTLQNGWCITPPQLSLSGVEPVPGYNIFAIEGTLNGQPFACTNASCNLPLIQGNNNLTYWALSSFGDSSTMGGLTAKVDSQLPNITASISGTTGLNGWYLGPVTLTSSASDATSGLISYTCTRDGAALGSCNAIAVNSDGSHTLVLTARDHAGNARVFTQNASIDAKNPVLDASLNGTVGSNSWYTAVVLNASASDPSPGSGLSALQYNFDGSGWTTFPAAGTLNLSEGKHNVDLRAVDKAGRTVSSSKSYWLDAAAPGVNLDASGTLGLNNWYIAAPTLTASASDDTSGLDLLEYSLDGGAWTAYTDVLSLSDGVHSLSIWAQDQAGLVTQVDGTYQVDTRAPQIAGSLSGTPGINGWYISEVTVSASASDPLPGSDMDAFTYTLSGGAETTYTGPLNLSDGQHTLQLVARDRAGLSYSIDQTFNVDTIQPSVTIDTALPNWINGTITLNGTAGDNGSGLSSVEISFDGGQTWQVVTGTNAWSHTWNTVDGANGIREIRVRATDQAGLSTEQAVSAAVDNQSPSISLPDSWLQWDSVTLGILDEHSGISEARVEISDSKGRWPTRVIQLDPGQFPLTFKWDRRFADGTIAEAGTYDVKVFAADTLGNTTEKSAAIHVLLEILPPGPTSTQPYTPTVTVNTATPAVSSTAALLPTTSVNVAESTSTPRATQNVIVRVFGTIEPTLQTSSTPTAIPTLRATPTRSTTVDLLQSIFAPDTTEPSTTEIITTQDSPLPVSTNNSVLWGTAATAAIAAAATYVQEEKRRREEEIARQKALEEQEEERREKKKEKKIAKMEAQRVQEEAWEQARQETWNPIHINLKVEGFEAKESEAWVTGQAELREQHEAKKQAEAEQAEKEKKNAQDLQAKLLAQYASIQQKESEKELPKAELTWWDKTKSFVKDNVIQPVNTYVYTPIVKPVSEKRDEIAAKAVTWLDKIFYQPFVQPAVERSKQFLTDEFNRFNEEIVEPYIKPVIEKVSVAVAKSIAWVNENVYQPHLKPAIEKTIQDVSKGIEWINKKVYEPYIQPTVKVINEKVYQPYIQPVVEKINQVAAKNAAWIDENIYQPYIDPIVSDINQHIYQPLVNKATNWWDQYGEWVHGALDAAGFVPGLGEIADGLNGLIYLGEGRYLDASLSLISMIPLIGDLGKAGKWTLKAGQEIVETAVTKIAKEVAEEAVEKVTKELLEEGAEKVLKETGEELIEKTVKEVGEELVEKITKETLEESTEKVFKEVSEETVEAVSEKTTKEILEEGAEKVLKETGEELTEKTVKEAAEELVEKITKEALEESAEKVFKEGSEETVEIVSEKTTKEITEEVTSTASKDIAEEIVEEAPKQIDEAQFINSLREQYGDQMVDAFLPFCEKYDINPYDVLTRPPAEGQTLIGWGLGIGNSASPANHPLVNLNLTRAELDNILKQHIKRPDSKVVVLGYGGDVAKPYYVLSEDIQGCHLSLPAEVWEPFENARANFLVDINIPFVEKGIEDRKIFLFNVDPKVIEDPANVRRFSLPELRLIEMEKNNYVRVPVGEYTGLVPIELLDTYEEYLPSSLFR